MGIFPFDEMSPLGRVQSVDTANVIVCVEDPLQLSQLQVNHLVAIRSSKTGQAGADHGCSGRSARCDRGAGKGQGAGSGAPQRPGGS